MIVNELLVEAVVVDVDAVDNYVASFARQVSNPQAKKWFTKTLRSYILNNEPLLTQLSSEQLKRRQLPNYAQLAAEQGQPVYTFRATDHSVERLTTQMQHIVDWFNAMQDVVESPAETDIQREDKRTTEKILSKISRLTPDTITKHADRWSARMGSRLSGDKAGVEMIKRWPNGFYAVRYVDVDTMKQDGRDMQNCLQHGYYWEEVARGDRTILGIRKPNDEAIVAIRIEGDKTGEVKGKNNRPVAVQYAPYAADLLNHVKAKGNTYDTEEAMIYYQSGRYAFGFDDAAEKLYDKNDIVVKKAGDRIGVYFDNTIVMGKIRHGVLSEIDHEELSRIPQVSLVEMLDTVALKPSVTVAENFEEIGVFYSEGYGDIDSVRSRKYQLDETTKLYHLAGSRFYIANSNKVILAKYHVKKGVLTKSFSNASRAIEHRAVRAVTDKAKVKIRNIDASFEGFWQIKGQIIGNLDEFAEFYRKNATIDFEYDRGVDFQRFITYHSKARSDIDLLVDLEQTDGKREIEKIDQTARKLASALISHKPKITKASESVAYKLTIPTYHLWLPVLAAMAGYAIDDEEKRDKIFSYVKKTVDAYVDFITKNQVARFVFIPEGWKALTPMRPDPFQRLLRAQYDADQELQRVAGEQQRRHQSSEMDLSARFASLNTLRKIGKT